MAVSYLINLVHYDFGRRNSLVEAIRGQLNFAKDQLA